ncbi:hypothetical protein BP00DRAFT_444603 [Aspergillus indologenus CBS 114.80]|uniref:Uncharacterized protein n=1 Tax=Aspergillus indologenus CBS 114.80 TaxID=1450541 RepID=A0A2V5IBZ6_9EURO|nr:hypothetical protein BP00DRAFT_444603 [Aspergillus indologenus CBS 114.80]
MSATSTPELPEGRVPVKRIPDYCEWEAALPAFNDLWQEMREAWPELVEVPMGGLMVRGHYARFVYGAPEGEPARFLGRDKLDFDLSLPEDCDKFIEKADVLKEFLWAGGDSWQHTLEVLQGVVLAVRRAGIS